MEPNYSDIKIKVEYCEEKKNNQLFESESELVQTESEDFENEYYGPGNTKE